MGWLLNRLTKERMAKKKKAKEVNKRITHVWTFASSSGSGTYETLQYADGSTSCACMGWCRRVASDGSRSCKHTRYIDQGIADAHCISSHDYDTEVTVAPLAITQPPTKTTKSNATRKKEIAGRQLGERKFFLE